MGFSMWSYCPVADFQLVIVCFCEPFLSGPFFDEQGPALLVEVMPVAKPVFFFPYSLYVKDAAIGEPVRCVRPITSPGAAPPLPGGSVVDSHGFFIPLCCDKGVAGEVVDCFSEIPAVTLGVCLFYFPGVVEADGAGEGCCHCLLCVLS